MLASQGDLVSEDLHRAIVNGVSSSDEEEDKKENDEDLLFAPDSSDDDELDGVDKEVNFDDDSDSEDEEDEQEEFDYMRKQEEKMVSLEDGPVSTPSDEEGKVPGGRDEALLSSSSDKEGKVKSIETNRAGETTSSEEEGHMVRDSDEERDVKENPSQAMLWVRM